jgi:hypothetical protein
LKQLDIAPGHFKVEHLRKQVAMYCLRNAYVMNRFVNKIKIDEGSFEAWIQGIVCGDVWGDETVLIAIAKMWNVAITVITVTGDVRIFHNKDVADIYLLANGVRYKFTHFSATGKRKKHFFFFVFHVYNKTFINTFNIQSWSLYSSR